MELGNAIETVCLHGFPLFMADGCRRRNHSLGSELTDCDTDSIGVCEIASAFGFESALFDCDRGVLLPPPFLMPPPLDPLNFRLFPALKLIEQLDLVRWMSNGE